MAHSTASGTSLSTAVVLGYDAVSSLGCDLDHQWVRAKRGESGIGPLTRFDIDAQFPVQIAGQVEEIDVSPYPFLSPRKLALWPSPLSSSSSAA